MDFSIWNEQFWLPENTKWENLSSNGDVVYPQFEELRYSILLGVCLLLVRIIFESFVFLPFGYYGGFTTQNKVKIYFLSLNF